MLKVKQHEGVTLKVFAVLLALVASLVLASTASAGNGHRHHHYPKPPPPPVFVPQVNRDGACASTPVLRSDGTFGLFVDLNVDDFASGVYQGVSFTPAFYVQGLGETCNIPAGYHAAGYNVSASDGTVDVAAPQFNTHPLYVRN